MRWEQVHTKRRGGDVELSGAVLQLRRGAGNRSARVFIILFFVVVKGAKNFAALSGRLTIALYHAQQYVYNITQQLGGVGVLYPHKRNFPAQFLDKTGAWKKTPDKSAAPARVCSRGRRHRTGGGGSFRRTLVRSVFEHDGTIFGVGFTRRSAKLAPWAKIRPRLQVAAR